MARIREEKILRLLVEGTVSETGAGFFRALVRNLGAALQTKGAWVTEFLPEQRRLRALAFWLNGEFVEGYEHPIDNTPCQAVIDTKSRAHFPDRLIDLFPDDPDIQDGPVMSYLGAPLLDADGNLLGHIAVLDDRPMPEEPGMFALFDLFAQRAVAELQRLRAETAARERETQLNLLLATAMDAIFVLDADFRILRVNPRACELFACTEEDLVGEGFADFLSQGAVAQFRKLTGELETGSKPLWVPEGLEAVRWDRTPLPVEAAISRYLFKDAPYFAVFLRSVNERLEAERRIRALTEEAEYLREVAGETELGIGGNSPGIRGVRHAIRQVAPTDATVLLLGETGTGKELAARAVHEASRRSSGPLVRVNCAAIPETLIESEFFGHEKGAFTGATARREGRFAQADGGTLFLDEVGELPLDLQAKLLRALQEGEFEPVGGGRTVKVDVRVIAATNRNLEEEAAAGRFREDLFYRLNVFPIRLPPLRERGDDVILLAESLGERLARRMGRSFGKLDDAAKAALRAYDWPGNVRELQNVIERALILSRGSKIDLVAALPGTPPVPSGESAEPAGGRIITAAEFLDLEKANLQRALEASGGKISGQGGVAERLGLPASTVASRLKALGIRRP
jgi:PAS domain S-box-containing protein